MKKYYLIKFNDLSEEKQYEIKRDIYEDFVEDKEVQPETLDLMIDGICDRAWCEMEVDTGFETSEDKWRTDAYLDGVRV